MPARATSISPRAGFRLANLPDGQASPRGAHSRR
jgi:hypothetical protein